MERLLSRGGWLRSIVFATAAALESPCTLLTGSVRLTADASGRAEWSGLKYATNSRDNTKLPPEAEGAGEDAHDSLAH